MYDPGGVLCRNFRHERTVRLGAPFVAKAIHWVLANIWWPGFTGWKAGCSMTPRRRALRVFLADDHAILRQGLKALLEQNGFEVVGEASDGQSAIKMCHNLQPEIAIIDIGMPVLNGIEATRQIRKSCPDTKIIILTFYADEASVIAGLRAGAAGYLLKSNPFSSLIGAIEAVSNSETYLSPEVTGTVVQVCISNAAPPAADPLSARERQVLRLIAEGQNMKEIGSTLGISPKTADSHRNRLMRKLAIFNTAGLVRYAQKNGLIVEQKTGSDDIQGFQTFGAKR
jgi:DNA-binding NarL/FixJ family response regulator